MKNRFRNIMLMVACSMSLLAVAQTEPLDTVYFYRTWAEMLNVAPSAYIVNPFIDVYSDCEIYIETGDEETNKLIEDEYIAFSRDNAVWLLNSKYLKKNFKGDVRGHQGFVPVYFNDKTAFITSYGPVSVKEVLFGNSDDGTTMSNMDYFYIDFVTSTVHRVTNEYLSHLLEDYHDLQMRYEGMKDYKKRYIIEDYFFKYIDRATDDVMHPNILDLVE